MPAAKPRTRDPEPAWGIAELFPPQGQWSEDEYLALRAKRLVEFDNGVIEVLPMPTTSHQLISAFLYSLMLRFVTDNDLGMLLFAPIKVRLWSGKYREPDILFMARNHADRVREEYWLGADLVVEVVSPDDQSRRRDLREKRRDYAHGRVSEYWIVDPQKQRVTVLRLRAGKYLVHGVYKPGEDATSARWPGFRVAVADLFRAGQH